MDDNEESMQNTYKLFCCGSQAFGFSGRIHMFKKSIALITMLFVLLLAQAAIVYAAPKTMPDGNLFDPEFYAASNPDVLMVYGADESNLYDHYLTYGKNEGRQPYNTAAEAEAESPETQEAAEKAAAEAAKAQAEKAQAEAEKAAAEAEAAKAAVEAASAITPAETPVPDQITPVSNQIAPTIFAQPMVALTFDDGPSVYDDRILAALEAVNGKATFFMVGNRIPKYISQVQRMAIDGCELGNHTWDHDKLTTLTPEEIVDTVATTNEAIRMATGQYASVVRPPYGSVNDTVKATLGNMGYSPILWSIDTRDWETRNAASTINAVMSKVQDGDIILMHSLYDASAQAAEQIIPALAAKGYALVTVSQLAAARGGMLPGATVHSFK